MSDLGEAERAEQTLREQLADLVRARARAESESRRLSERAGLAGAEPSLAELAERYRAQGERLQAEVEALRTDLRRQEAEVERLRAAQGGA
jgi:chromosome segregation ATPase